MLPDRVPVEEYQLCANALGGRADFIRAVSIKEAAENPHALRFEKHVWKRYRFASREAKAFDGVANPKTMAERLAMFERMDAVCQDDAMLNPHARDAAILCHSFGWCQVMGFNHKACGFETAVNFRAAMRTLEGQRTAFVQLVRSDANLHDALKREDFALWARHYNGPAYARNNYDTDHRAIVARLRSGGSAYA